MIVPRNAEEYLAALPHPIPSIGGMLKQRFIDRYTADYRKAQNTYLKKKRKFIQKGTPKHSVICGHDWNKSVTDKVVCLGEHSFVGAPDEQCPNLETCELLEE